MNRKNLILSALLVLQIVLVVIALRPAATRAPEKKTFFPDLATSQVTKLVIRDADKDLTLVKKGDTWFVKSDAEYPADQKKITDLLDKLTGLSSKRLVARTRASHIRLKVDDEVFNRRIEILTGDVPATIFLGTSPTYKTLHVRMAGENEVYLVRDLSIWEAQTGRESWWKTRYLDLAADSLTKVSLTNANGSFTLLKNDGNWRLENEDRPLLDKAVRDFIDAARSISLLKYLGTEEKPEYGLDKPAATLTVATSDGNTITVVIGPKNEEENNHVVKADNSPFYVSVASYTVEDLLNRKSTDLLAPVEKAEQSTTASDQKEDSAGH